MTKKEKMVLVLAGVKKIFVAVGREPTEETLQTFAEMLIPYDIRCMLQAIRTFILKGDAFPSVSKIVNLYFEIKEQTLRDMYFDMIRRCKSGEITEKERQTLIEIARLPKNSKSEEIANDYKRNEEYARSRVNKFLDMFPEEDIKPLQIDHDILMIGGKNE